MKQINKIMVFLTGNKKEKKVFSEAVRFSKLLNSEFSVVHVNHPYAGALWQRTSRSPKKITKEMIVEQIKDYGFSAYAESIDIQIFKEYQDQIDELIAKACENFDLLIIGHESMSDLESMLRDSLDETITNKVECPVLVIQL